MLVSIIPALWTHLTVSIYPSICGRTFIFQLSTNLFKYWDQNEFRNTLSLSDTIKKNFLIYEKKIVFLFNNFSLFLIFFYSILLFLVYKSKKKNALLATLTLINIKNDLLKNIVEFITVLWW